MHQTKVISLYLVVKFALGKIRPIACGTCPAKQGSTGVMPYARISASDWKRQEKKHNIRHYLFLHRPISAYQGWLRWQCTHAHTIPKSSEIFIHYYAHTHTRTNTHLQNIHTQSNYTNTCIHANAFTQCIHSHTRTNTHKTIQTHIKLYKHMHIHAQNVIATCRCSVACALIQSAGSGHTHIKKQTIQTHVYIHTT